MTTLTDLIKSAERKIADPTTTPQTVGREKAIAHYLISMQAEIDIQHETIESLRAENAELYARICEMGKKKNRMTPEGVFL